MRRRVFVESFYDSLAALDESEETIETLGTLLKKIAPYPERGRIVTGTDLLLVRQRDHLLLRS